MNNKLKNLIIIFFTFLFAVFFLNILIKGIETNKTDITKMKILNYIPSNYELTIISNSTNDNIKRYINKNISEKKQDEINMIKESTISYLGFNLQEKIENLYDNEFALTFFVNKLNKIDTLLIFKLKENKDINNIINIGEELNKSDKIIELKRLGKLNYISHIFQTKDNYIIASSNKKIIDSSLRSNNNEILSRDLIPDDIDLKEVKLLSISKYTNPKIDSNLEPKQFNKLITIINYEDNNIKLRSFTPNINKINTKVLNHQIDNIKDIIFTNKYSTYKKNFNFLYNDINQKEFIEGISKELNEELVFITNNNNWVLCFKSELPNKISNDQFNLLKNYQRENLYFNNMNYSIYINDRLKIKDNNIIHEKENPIFSCKDEVNTYFSNNLDALLKITNNSNLSDQYLNNNDKKPNKYILNDIVFIKDINNKQLLKYYKSLKNIQYFINTELFSLDDISVNITHTIPERYEKVYLESNLRIL
tara:strand:- start:289 stop:1725 length:1437 start_codon:yes stop_codon:yes gene_type:complete